MRMLNEQPPGFDPSLPWEDREVTLMGATRLFRQIQARRRSPHTAREHDFTRLACPEWINVIAFTEGLEALLVEQFRHGIDASTLEVVGGVVDPGEPPFEAARRELLEETGHEAGRWVSLGSCAPNPAVQDNRCHFYLALDCVAVAGQDLDPAEEIRIWSVPWPEMKALLVEGKVDHALVMAAFLRLTYWEGWPLLEARLLAPA